MNTHVAKLTAFNVLLNITDLLAPSAKTQVISIVMPNAIKSGGRPVTNNRNINQREDESEKKIIYY